VGGVKCTAPGCVQGKVTVRAGGRTERQDCPKCQGQGLVRCELCRGTGLDLQLIPPKAKQIDPSTNPPAGNPPVAGEPSTPQPGAPSRQYTLEFGSAPQMNFRYIEPGTFLMGGPRNGRLRTEGQTPHEVTLSKPYYIATTEVTQAQWMTVMGTNPSRNQGDGQRPVEHVTWNDCQQFIGKLNQRLKNSNSKFRLPTEAEWEYACRAGSSTTFSFGEDIGQLPQYAWFDKSSDGTTHPVGKLLPNAWNLFDMHGNVMEWCADFYDPGYGNSSAPAQDPTGPTQGSERVTRGGCWFWRDDTAISGGRNHFPQNKHFDLIGFRLVCERQ
jgi:formylglycine-generating enzyme required for sulfatase activity